MNRFFSRHAETIQRWLTHRHLPIILACVGIIITLPSLGTGLISDDYVHQEKLAGSLIWTPAQDASLFGLFSWLDGTPEQIRALKETGVAPWWMRDDFGTRIVFWRPLTELTHWLDYQLWADAPWLMHLHSLLWFGATIWVITKLYRKLIGPVWVAGLAGVFFAFNGFHGLIAALICHRNTLIAAFFGTLALLAHIRWRQEGWRPGAVWGPLCYLLGLLSKEAALATGAYLFAYTFFLDQGQIPPIPPLGRGGTQRLESVRWRIIAFLPYVVITFGWYFIYRHLGFGARDAMPLYLDPNSAPLMFAKSLFIRIPVLLLGKFTGFPIELWNVVAIIFPQWNVLVWCVVAAVLALIGFILYPLFKRDAVVRFWLVGTVLGLVPICAVAPSHRLLFFAGIGAMGTIAKFLASWFEQPDWLPIHRFWAGSARVWCILVVLVYLILSPLVLQVFHDGLGNFDGSVLRVISTMPYDEDISQKTVVLVNPPIAPVVGAFISTARAVHGYPVPARTWSLAPGLRPLTITRIDEHSVDIECEKGLLLPILGDALRGKSHPMHVGQQIVLFGMSVEVLALLDDWQPSRARFTFTVPLDDPSLVLLRWEEGKDFIPYTPPAVGESESLRGVPPEEKMWQLSVLHQYEEYDTTRDK